jgi:predicted ATP-grasp superfamily ATP-dependent carboligase
VERERSVILVLDGETRAALAVVRSLGRAGHAVEVVSTSGRSLAGASRHARGDHALPDPAADPDAFVRELEALCATLDGPLVLPVTEVTLGTLYASGLDRRLDVLAPDPERYEAAVDKACLLERAARLGIDVPRSVGIAPGTVPDALPPGFAFPVVLKARRSRFVHDGRWEMGGVGIADAPEALAALARQPGMQGGALLQEFVPGTGEAVFAIARDGECQAVFAHRRLREKPPSGGVSVLRESIDPDPVLLDQSRRLLRDLGWTGVAMVEYRRAPDGRAVLMEINPRFWGSLQLAIDAGVDFPSLAVALHRTGACPTARARAGVRTRWLLGDVDHLLIGLRDAHARAAVGRTRAGLLRAFFGGFCDGSRTEVLRWNDPRPFARELRGWLGELVRGTPG